MVNIFEIQPSVITRDLSGKSFFIYGERKSGKTSNAVLFPKPLLMGFEKGWDFLSGIRAIPINNWRQALEIKEQLLMDAQRVLQEKKAGNESAETFYKTVIVDTADIAYDFCEQFVVEKDNIEYLDESINKRAYRSLSKEYDKFFQEIVKAGYTLVIISHATSKQIKENGEKYDKTIPTVPDRGFQVIARLVDVTAYASYETNEETNESVSMLTMRGNKFLEAGSRNKFMSERIPFTYQALKDDMAHAIDMLEKSGEQVINTVNNPFEDSEPRADFNTVKQSIGKIARILSKKDEQAIEIGENPCFMEKYREIVEEYLGRNRLVKDSVPSQLDMLVLILNDLKRYCTDKKIKIEN